MSELQFRFFCPFRIRMNFIESLDKRIRYLKAQQRSK